MRTCRSCGAEIPENQAHKCPGLQFKPEKVQPPTLPVEEHRVNTVQIGELFAVTLQKPPAPGELIIVGITTLPDGKVRGASCYVPQGIVSSPGAMGSVIKSMAEDLEIEFSVPQD